MRGSRRRGKGSCSRRSESPSGAVATAADLGQSLRSESAAPVPEVELKPAPSRERGCRRAGEAGQVAAAGAGPGLGAPRPRGPARTCRPPGLPLPGFVCVCAPGGVITDLIPIHYLDN